MTQLHAGPELTGPAEPEAVSVLLVDDEPEWVTAQQRLLERAESAVSVTTATSIQAARESLAGTIPDCVVCDYQLEHETGLDLLTDVREDHPSLPFILITGQGDEGLASEAIRKRVTDYITKSDASADATGFVQRILRAVEHHRTQRALARERQSKDAMLDILTETTSHEDVARELCRHLVRDRGYDCAWIGTDESPHGVVTHTVVGDRSYPETVLESATPADGTAPSLVALATGEPCLVSLTPDGEIDEWVVGDASDSEPATAPSAPTGPEDWQQAASQRGYRAVGAVPFGSGSTVDGVLAVYAGAADGIDRHERELLEEYGDTVGYSVQVTGWKESLITTTPVAITFEVTDDRAPLVALGRELPDEASVTILTSLFQDESVRYVGRSEGLSAQQLRAVASEITGVTVDDIVEQTDAIQWELVVPTPTPESVFAERGARVFDTIYEEGCQTVQTIRPTQTDTESLASALRDVYDDVTIGPIRSIQSIERQVGSVFAELTSRQQQVLKLAYYDGYFDWPREHDAGELADKLGINRSTLSQHLRAAERKVFTRLFDRE